MLLPGIVAYDALIDENPEQAARRIEYPAAGVARTTRLAVEQKRIRIVGDDGESRGDPKRTVWIADDHARVRAPESVFTGECGESIIVFVARMKRHERQIDVVRVRDHRCAACVASARERCEVDAWLRAVAYVYFRR